MSGLSVYMGSLHITEVMMQRKRVRGMSLIEIMVVITLIALVTAAISVSVFRVKSDADPDIARSQAREIAKAVEIYRLKQGALPSGGLEKLTDPPPLLASLPRDPWGNAYAYVNPGEKNPYGFDVVSAGPDGVINTHDDVGNWTQ